jgi:hypothetical protein
MQIYTFCSVVELYSRHFNITQNQLLIPLTPPPSLPPKPSSLQYISKCFVALHIHEAVRLLQKPIVAHIYTKSTAFLDRRI